VSETFSGTPAHFLNSVISGAVRARAALVVGATETTYDPITGSTPKFCIAVGAGNSLTLDYFDTMTTLLVANQASHPLQVWYAVNKATGGIQTPALASEFMTAVHRFYNPARLCLLHFCELTNHIGAGASFTVARDAAISYCDTARSLGWKVAFHIPTPRAQKSDPGYSGSASAWATGQKAIYDQAVAYFRAHPEHYDYVLDLAAVPELDDPLDTFYYQADGCHLNANAITAKANAVAAAHVSWSFP